jgi:hypothetical protein
MNLKSNDSLNIVKADTIKMATKKAPPKGKDLLRRLVLAEAANQGLVGQALVANSLFNRIAIMTGSKGIGSPDNIGGGRYSGKRKALSTFYTRGKNSRMPNRESIDSTILASGQYQPISDGKIWTVGQGKNNALTPSQIAEADEAIELAKNKDGLEEALIEKKVDSADVDKLLDATSFRTKGALKDPSQRFNPMKYGNHVFNSAGYPSSLELDIPPGGDVDPVDGKNQAEADRIAAAEREDAAIKEMEAAGGKKLGFFDKLGQTGDILGSMVGLGSDRERTVEAGDTAYGIARKLGVDVGDLGGLGKDPDLIHPGDVLTAPAKTWEEEFEDLKRVWGLYEGGIVDRADVSERIHNIMKPRN